MTASAKYSVSYRPDIDGLRALAVLVVVWFHYFPATMSGGFVGVDVFFVISGYLIGRSCLQELAAGCYSPSTYFGRRARRIFPALLTVLFFSLGLGWLVLTPVEYALLGKHIAGASVFISNWQFWREVGYFNTEAALKPLLHLWSLAVEEQFYLLLPLFLVAAPRLSIAPLKLLGIVGGLSFVAAAWRVGDHKAWAYFHVFSRFWELMLGIMLAGLELRRRGAVLPVAWQGVAAFSGCVLIVTASIGYSSHTIFPGASALLPTLGAALVIAAGMSAVPNRVLALRPVVYVGLISYPLYLWHWPLLSLLRQVDGMALHVSDLFLALLLSFCLAGMTYHLIEAPLRQGRAKTWRFLPVMQWGMLLIVGGLGLYIHQHQGLPGRFNDFDTTLQPATSDQIQPSVGFSSAKKVILLGDSHALMYAASLRSYYYTRHGKEMIEAYRAGCKPFLDLDKQTPGNAPMDCPSSVNPAIERAIKDTAIDTVVIVSSLASFTHMTYPDWTEAPSADPAVNYQLVGKAFDATFSRLIASGKKIIVFYTTPMLDIQPVACQERPVRWHSKSREDCAVDRQQYDEMQAWSRARLGELAKYENIHLFDPAPILCDAGHCQFRADGKLLYADVAHLNALGAQRVARHFDF